MFNQGSGFQLLVVIQSQQGYIATQVLRFESESAADDAFINLDTEHLNLNGRASITKLYK